VLKGSDAAKSAFVTKCLKGCEINRKEAPSYLFHCLLVTFRPCGASSRTTRMPHPIELESPAPAASRALAEPPPLPPALPEPLPPAPGSISRIFRALSSAVDWLCGFATILGGVAVLSILPGLNLLSLGYLLQASGRVAATGRIRDGFIGVRKASIVGQMIFGTWFVLWPPRIVSGFWRDADLIAPHGIAARHWRLGLLAVSIVTLWHIAWACFRGGRLQHFLWPAPIRFCRWLVAPQGFSQRCDAIADYLSSLHLPRLFWIGLQGFAGAIAWLILPVGVLWAATLTPRPVAAFLSLAGMFLLVLTIIYLPFLQTNFARTGRFRSLFEVREVRALFRRAPIAFWLALLITLLFALPLYLLKIELPPRDLAWLPSLVFVAFILPARLLTGWAVSRGLRREQPRHAVFRWLARLAVIPVAVVYVLFVYLTQYVSWNGSVSLLEQHAFLVPAPLIAL